MQNHANLAMFSLCVITCMYLVDWLSIIFRFRIRALHNQHWALCKQDKKFIVEKSIIYICPEEFNAGLDITIISNCGLESRVFFFPSCSCRKSICFRLNICLKEWYSYVFNVLFLFKRRKKKNGTRGGCCLCHNHHFLQLTVFLTSWLLVQTAAPLLSLKCNQQGF